MATFTTLGTEILASICELIDDTSPTSTPSLARVNKQVHAISRLVIHRRKVLTYTEGALHCINDDVEIWLHDDEILRGLRSLAIRSRRPAVEEDGDDYTDPYEKWGQLVRFIEKLTHLKLLSWEHDATIPLCVLEALHKHQKRVELQVWDFQRDVQEADENVAAEVALASSPALTSIKSTFRENGGFPDLREACFRRIVANAPNLKFASLCKLPSGGFYTLRPEQVQEQANLANRFYTHTKPNESLRRLTLDGYGLSEGLLRDWEGFVDLSKLNSIKCSRGTPNLDYFSYAPTVLTSLKHVSLNLNYAGGQNDQDEAAEAVETYLVACGPLQSLSLWSWMGKVSLDLILARHGPTLETLQLHERETTEIAGSGKRKVITVDDMKMIHQKCPKLRALTIDCDRHTKDLETELDVDPVVQYLAQMSLSKVHIYYDYGLAFAANQTGVGAGGAVENDTNGSQINNNENNDDNDDDDADDADAAATNATPPQVPPSPLPPSQPSQIEAYVASLWQHIFGSQAPFTSARTLEVKMGEWERKLPSGNAPSWMMEEAQNRTWWIVKPEERDDLQDDGDCVVEGYGNCF